MLIWNGKEYARIGGPVVHVEAKQFPASDSWRQARDREFAHRTFFFANYKDWPESKRIEEAALMGNLQSIEQRAWATFVRLGGLYHK